MTRQAIGMVLIALAGMTGCAESVTAPEVAVERPRQDDIRIEPGSWELTAVGERVQLEVLGLDGPRGDLPGPHVSWFSLDPHIATVDAMGVVEARADGVARIIATLNEQAGAELHAAITVRQRATDLFAREEAVHAWVGRTTQLSVEGRDANGHVLPPYTLEWYSSDPTIASVDVAGLLTGHRAGIVQVRAGRDGLETLIRVEVEHAFIRFDAGAR